MKSGLLLALAASSAVGLVAAAPASKSTRAANPSKSGTQFTIDGNTNYFAGTNAYWLPFQMNNADIDLVMSHLQSSGLKILRVWGFNDVNSTPGSGTVWFQSFVPGAQPVINTGANGLQRLDYVVQSAANHDIKLIINFVNNWSDYGGMPAYEQFYNLNNNAAWYTSAPAQAQYQAYIAAVVNRYASSPAIFAWELANEPRCSGCPTSTITNWATTTSQYIKSLDPSHMVAIGDEGMGLTAGGDGSYPYTMAEGLDFAANLAIPTIDFGTMHLYPESWGVSGAPGPWGDTWINSHAAACAAAGKPCLLEEYGVSEAANHCPVEGEWQGTAQANRAKGVGADLFWQDGDQLSSGQTPNDGYTIYYGSSDWTCLVSDHVQAIGS